MKEVFGHFLLISTIVMCGNTASAQQPVQGSFYVDVNGDTTFNLAAAFIDVDAHPQRVHYTKPDQTKTSISADSVLFLRFYQKLNSFKDWVLSDFVSGKIPIKKGFCIHFLKAELEWNKYSISYSPYCNQCSFLSYYLVTESSQVQLITRKNFNTIVNEYFEGCLEAVSLSSIKNYNPHRFSRYLRKLKK
jgi:hypothetical protein